MRNAANVNRQTSVKTTLLFLSQLVCVCLSEWDCKWEKETLFLFQCVCACWMVKDQHCMIGMNTQQPTVLTLCWTELWPSVRLLSSSDLSWFIFWSQRPAPLLWGFQNHEVLKSDFRCDWSWHGMFWSGLEMVLFLNGFKAWWIKT